MKNLFITTITLLALSLSSCKKDIVTPPAPEPEAPMPAAAGSINIIFKGMVGDSSLVLNTETYTNQAGNPFTVTAYKYYISNIKFTKVDNSIWVESNSYHLIDHSSLGSTLINIANVPFGNYKAVEFMIGVDSLRNFSGNQTGALDVTNGMFWDWNQGYIMAKFEGITSGQNIKHHIGGWNASVGPNVIKIVSPSFSSDTAKVTASGSPTIQISSNLLEWFKSPTIVDFATFPKVIMNTGVDAKTISDNYADMFSVQYIHNN